MYVRIPSMELPTLFHYTFCAPVASNNERSLNIWGMLFPWFLNSLQEKSTKGILAFQVLLGAYETVETLAQHSIAAIVKVRTA